VREPARESNLCVPFALYVCFCVQPERKTQLF